MSILVDIFQGIGTLVVSLIHVYMWVIIINALLSFVNPDPYNPVVQFLHRVTQPAYALVRRFVRTTFNGLDLAPFFVVILLQILIVLFSVLLEHSV